MVTLEGSWHLSIFKHQSDSNPSRKTLKYLLHSRKFFEPLYSRLNLYKYTQHVAQRTCSIDGSVLDRSGVCRSYSGAESNPRYVCLVQNDSNAQELIKIKAISAFDDLHRSAQLSSAAYSGCAGTAFDITITKTIYDAATDTNVRSNYLLWVVELLTRLGVHWILGKQEDYRRCHERLHYKWVSSIVYSCSSQHLLF